MHIAIIRVHVFFGHLLPGDGFLRRTIENFVVHIGKVFDVVHLIPPVTEVSSNDVKHNGTSGMAEMTFIVHRHPTDIHADLVRNEWNEFIFLIREGIEYFHGVLASPLGDEDVLAAFLA